MPSCYLLVKRWQTKLVANDDNYALAA